jgi:hypothetical protein
MTIKLNYTQYCEMTGKGGRKFLGRHSTYSHGHGISSVVVIQLTDVKQLLCRVIKKDCLSWQYN